MKTRKPKPRKPSPEQKVAILRQPLIDHKPVSELWREHQLHPNVCYRWQKEFFEGGVAAFEKASSAQLGRLQRQMDTLEAQRSTRNDVLAEVMEAYVRLKKNGGAR
jgi:transposase